VRIHTINILHKETAAVIIDFLRNKLLDRFIASWNPVILSDIFGKASADLRFLLHHPQRPKL
jgi:hypothetical protein